MQPWPLLATFHRRWSASPRRPSFHQRFYDRLRRYYVVLGQGTPPPLSLQFRMHFHLLTFLGHERLIGQLNFMKGSTWKNVEIFDIYQRYFASVHWNCPLQVLSVKLRRPTFVTSLKKYHRPLWFLLSAFHSTPSSKSGRLSRLGICCLYPWLTLISCKVLIFTCWHQKSLILISFLPFVIHSQKLPDYNYFLKMN